MYTKISWKSIDFEGVPAISEALAKCENERTIVIPAGQIFTSRSPLYFNKCNSCDFQIEGPLKLSDDVDYWQTQQTVFHLGDIKDVIFQTCMTTLTNEERHSLANALNSTASA